MRFPMKHWPEKDKRNRIQTKNNKGFMFVNAEGASTDFINDLSQFKGRVADIGCAYGVVTLAVLQNSLLDILAFDLSQEHLDIVKNSADEKYLSRLTLQKGKFPNDFNVADESLEAIHSSLVLHFLTGDEIEIGLKKLYHALQPGGKLYLNLVSVYIDFLDAFIPIYEEKAKNNLPWPGEMNNYTDYVPEEDKAAIPDVFHVFKKEDLAQHLIDAGFKIDLIEYFDHSDYATSNDKGLIKIIASKKT
jgi:SAM-dependent methyltransferase